jgi:hypothetical protein
MSTGKTEESGWTKIDLHIHTLDDPKDAVDFSAHQLLERARSFGFAFSPSLCMMLSLIERKYSLTRRQWAFC